MSALYILQYAKGICLAEAVSNSEKLKPIALATIIESDSVSCVVLVSQKKIALNKNNKLKLCSNFC